MEIQYLCNRDSLKFIENELEKGIKIKVLMSLKQSYENFFIQKLFDLFNRYKFDIEIIDTDFLIFDQINYHYLNLQNASSNKYYCDFDNEYDNDQRILEIFKAQIGYEEILPRTFEVIKVTQTSDCLDQMKCVPLKDYPETSEYYYFIIEFPNGYNVEIKKIEKY